MTGNFHFRGRGLIAAIAVLAIAVGLAACGGGGSSSTTTTGGGSEAETTETTEANGGAGSENSAVAAAKAAVEKAQAPQTKWAGPKTSPPIAKGKKVAVITCSPSEGCNRDPEGFVEAAEKVGWSVQTYKTEGTVQEVTKAVEQALSSGVNGIAIASFPAIAIPNQLKRAKELGVPIVTMLSGVEEPKQPGIKGGYLATVEPNPQYKGEIAGDWVVAESNGEAEAGVITEEAFPIVVQYVEGFEHAFEQCEGCKIGQVFDVPVAEVPSKVAPATLSYLQSHPNSNYIFSYDYSLLTAEQAVKQSGREVVLAGTDGDLANLENIRKGAAQKVDVAIVLEWAGWAAIDDLNRAFNGKPPAPEWTAEGNAMPTRLLTAENLPPKGEPYLGDFNWRGEFEKMWGLK